MYSNDRFMVSFNFLITYRLILHFISFLHFILVRNQLSSLPFSSPRFYLTLIREARCVYRPTVGDHKNQNKSIKIVFVSSLTAECNSNVNNQAIYFLYLLARNTLRAEGGKHLSYLLAESSAFYFSSVALCTKQDLV